MVVDSTMARYPKASSFGGWVYYCAFYLLGQFMVYKRTGDPAYLRYIQKWLDAHIDSQGNIDTAITGLDYIQPGNLLLVVYAETHEERYRIAAETLHRRFNSYPRTSDGGFWHSATEVYKQHELWLDGTFMALPFLLRYGRLFGDETQACNEAAKQLLLDDKHLHAQNSGLLYHAYDERGHAPWAQPETHHSSVFWCRSIGWYGLTLVDTLDVLPHNHPQRPELMSILQRLVTSIAAYQDRATGLWYQVLDKPTMPGNWLETLSSSMFTYMIDVAVKRGHVNAIFHENAKRGYAGVMTQVSLNSDGLVDIRNICEGTDVSDASYYLARARNTNDPHGLGAFLLMNEEWNTSVASMDFPPVANAT